MASALVWIQYIYIQGQSRHKQKNLAFIFRPQFLACICTKRHGHNFRLCAAIMQFRMLFSLTMKGLGIVYAKPYILSARLNRWRILRKRKQPFHVINWFQLFSVPFIMDVLRVDGSGVTSRLEWKIGMN